MRILKGRPSLLFAIINFKSIYCRFAQSHIQASNTQVGSAAAAAELKELQKYADIIAGVDLMPVAIETSAVWGVQALDLIKAFGAAGISQTRAAINNIHSSAHIDGSSAW